jgi:glycerol-3-phosphate dehydrogenase
MSFSHLDRDCHIERLQNENWDLLIIGGGITGAGAARDAASRGMKVALVEAKDFAYGTSSRSSKLIHGGIRYLENFEFGLVFEALSERKLLFEIAPHMVHPLRFVLPIFDGGRVGMAKLGLGMWVYDALATFDAPEMHERLDRDQTMSHLPMLRSNGLCGSFVYSDAYMDDDLLVFETLRAAHQLGACSVNYVKAQKAQFSLQSKAKNEFHTVEVQDQLNGRNMQVRARHIISTVGPWTDDLGQKLFNDWKKILRPSKGVHLTLERSRLPLKDAVVMADDAKQRIVFGIPRHDMVIVGTTDTDYPQNPDDVHTDKMDAEYVLSVVKEYFPGANVTKEDVVASYAGVRPLVQDESETEGKTSREHMIMTDPRGVTFVAGGKYTTYRLMAEQTINEALSHFSVEDRIRFGRGNTKTALNPLATVEHMENARAHVTYWAQQTDLPFEDLLRLAGRYGMEAEKVLSCPKELTAGFALSDRVWALEAWHALKETMCLNLEDFYLRRTHLFLARRDHGLPLLEGLGALFAKMLRWDDARTKAEIAKVHKHIQMELGWKAG